MEDLSAWEFGKFQIRLIKSGAPWKTNCYLVRHLPSGEQAAIDPGDEAETIIQAVLTQGAELRYIWLTHAHHDHVGAVATLCRRFGLVCDLHKADVRLLRHAPMYALQFEHKIIEAPEPFRLYDTASQLQLGGAAVEVLHVPGHTAGSVCYSVGGFVFTGDTLLYEHVGRTDLPGGDAALLKISISQLVESLPGYTVIFPGHGRPWTVAEARAWWQTVTNDPPMYKAF
jgi:glyoxylase-like metal-dependent hydrolase (beta-lactamase superfamily II)